jgi:hypothetical protein
MPARPVLLRAAPQPNARAGGARLGFIERKMATANLGGRMDYEMGNNGKR